MAETQATATPLIERLRSIPKDARLTYEHSPTSHSVFPVGLMAHEVADALASSPTAADLDKDAEIARVERVASALGPHLRVVVGPNPDCDDQHRAQQFAENVARMAIRAALTKGQVDAG